MNPNPSPPSRILAWAGNLLVGVLLLFGVWLALGLGWDGMKPARSLTGWVLTLAPPLLMALGSLLVGPGPGFDRRTARQRWWVLALLLGPVVLNGQLLIRGSAASSVLTSPLLAFQPLAAMLLPLWIVGIGFESGFRGRRVLLLVTGCLAGLLGSLPYLLLLTLQIWNPGPMLLLHSGSGAATVLAQLAFLFGPTAVLWLGSPVLGPPLHLRKSSTVGGRPALPRCWLPYALLTPTAPFLSTWMKDRGTVPDLLVPAMILVGVLLLLGEWHLVYEGRERTRRALHNSALGILFGSGAVLVALLVFQLLAMMQL